MTTRSSIRTDWPGPPRHRHRKATTRRRWTLPVRWGIPGRIGIGVVALLAGVLALNGVIQASGSPARTAGNSPGVDIASLLPPPPAAAPTSAAAPTAQVAVVDERTEVAPSSQSRATPRPAAGRPTAQRSAAAAGAGSVTPEGSRSAPARPGTPAPARKQLNEQADEAGATAGDGFPVSREKSDTHVDGAQEKDTGPEPARDNSQRPGRNGLLDTVGCAVRVNGSPLVGQC
jgi:hypothetical protein